MRTSALPWSSCVCVLMSSSARLGRRSVSLHLHICCGLERSARPTPKSLQLPLAVQSSGGVDALDCEQA